MGGGLVACVLLYYMPDLIAALRDIAAALREREDEE